MPDMIPAIRRLGLLQSEARCCIPPQVSTTPSVLEVAADRGVLLMSHKRSGFSLYIHVPFCIHKCPYCDFNTYAVSNVPGESYVDGLLAELDFRLAQPEWHEREVNTVFFGGGTPSLLEPRLIAKVLTAIRERAAVQDGAEISLEANPGQASRAFLLGYREAGVNRVSFGAQSFTVSTLKSLGRLHTANDIATAFSDARSAGFDNINIDLIYGVPKQTLTEFKSDLNEALSLAPQHISLYGLTIEQGTPLHSAVARKDIIPLDDDTTLAMMEHGNERLREAGLEHYEVSNFSHPGYSARHNLAYWNGDDYLGLGAGAHSFFRVDADSAKRWSNISLPEEFSKRARASGAAESWQDNLKRRDLIFEFFFLGLRKRAGVSLNRFKELFGVDIDHPYPGLITVLCDQGLLCVTGDALSITAKGLPLSDSVVENFADPVL